MRGRKRRRREGEGEERGKKEREVEKEGEETGAWLIFCQQGWHREVQYVVAMFWG